MHYRNFTKDNIQVFALGFGCMRFPILDNDSSKIDEKQSIEMMRYAIDKGVNYIDTAYPYHQENSEYLVGKALKDGYREKVYLATKSPSWLIKSYDDFHKYLDEQLEKLDTDYIDFYLLHTLNKDYWKNLKALDVLKFIDEAKKSGKIKYIGFSFHDEIDVFKEIIDYYDWDFCQIQYNYLDENYQAGKEGLEYAYDKGISVVIMEPIKGGKLVNPSDEIKELWESSNIRRTPAEWALRWVLNHKEVSILLSGMKNIEEVKENIETVSNAKPNHLNKKEIEIIEKVRKIYQEKIKVGCTSCEYCLPCPEGVSIPNIFEVYNDLYVFGTNEDSRKKYKSYIEKGIDASKCIECGKCENMCPQNIEIIKALKEADEILRGQNMLEQDEKKSNRRKLIKSIIDTIDEFSSKLEESSENQIKLKKTLGQIDLNLLKLELDIFRFNQKINKKPEKNISPVNAYIIYKEKYPKAKIIKIELEKDKKEWLYKIKGYDKKRKYKLKIDFKNGNIIEEKEKEKNKDKSYREITKENIEQAEELTKISLKAREKKPILKEWSLEGEKDKIELEIELYEEKLGENKYEYDIDNGKLLK